MANMTVRIVADTGELRKALQDGIAQITAVGPSVEKLASTWSAHSQAMVEKAHLITAAVDQIGGVTNLTSRDASSAFNTLTAAMEHMRAKGQAIPPEMEATAASLRGVTTATHPAVAVTDSWTTSIGKMAAGYVAGMLTIEGAKRVIGELIGFVRESIAAAAEAEAIQVRLNSALTNTHQPVLAVSAAFRDYALHMQATTVLEDDAVISVMALATEMGVMAGDMGAVISASANLSAAWGVSLQDAMEIIVKGGEGMTKAFRAHAIELDTTKVASEGLSYVLGVLQEHFGTNAQDQLNTYAGRVTALGVAWDNFKEAVGGAATAGGTLANGIGGTTLVMRGLSEVIEKEGVVGLLKLTARGGDAYTQLLVLGAAATAAAAQLKATGDRSLDTADGVEQVSARVSALLTPALAALSPVQQGFIDQMNAANISTGDMAKALDVSASAIASYLEGVKTAKKVQEDAAKATKDWNDALNEIHNTTRQLASTWQNEVVAAANKMAAAVNASVASQLATYADFKEKNEQALMSAHELKLRLIDLEQAKVIEAAGRQHGVTSELYQMMSAEVQAYYDRQRLLATVSADTTIAEATRAADGVAASFLAVIGTFGSTQMPLWWTPAQMQAYATALGGTVAWDDYHNPYVQMPGRASGGPVSAGSPYVVGERGPEVFVPSATGTIVPHGAAGVGGLTVRTDVVINGSVLGNQQEIARTVGEAVMQSLRNAGVRLPGA